MSARWSAPSRCRGLQRPRRAQAGRPDRGHLRPDARRAHRLDRHRHRHDLCLARSPAGSACVRLGRPGRRGLHARRLHDRHATADNEATKNGYTSSTGHGQRVRATNPRELDVSITTQVPTFFVRIFGIKLHRDPHEPGRVRHAGSDGQPARILRRVPDVQLTSSCSAEPNTPGSVSPHRGYTARSWAKGPTVATATPSTRTTTTQAAEPGPEPAVHVRRHPVSDRGGGERLRLPL